MSEDDSQDHLQGGASEEFDTFQDINTTTTQQQIFRKQKDKEKEGATTTNNNTDNNKNSSLGQKKQKQPNHQDISVFSSWEESLSGHEESSDDQFSDSDISNSERKQYHRGKGGKITALSAYASSRDHHRNYQPYDDLTDTQAACLNFVMEHRIFLKAILGLLAERDNKATEIGMNDPNTIKSGPLKKASHLVSGVWKVKFVEVRRGMFSYYEDAVSGGDKKSKNNNSKQGGSGGGGGGSLLRKNIPLHSNDCTCRAVKIHQNGLNMAPGGAIFELKAGNTRRLWLAKSRAERQAWIQAINDAMVGGSVTQGTVKEKHGKSGTVNSKSPFKSDLRKYLKVKGILKNAKTKEEYVPGLRELLDQPLDVPVQWMMEQVDNPPHNTGGAFYEGELSKGVEQLWRDLLRDSIVINSELFHGDSGHGPEKMIGALARNIVGVSRSATTPGSSTKYAIAECKAVAYARDILLSINRTRSGGDSYFCIDTLCNNNNSLIVTTPTSREAEPLSIVVETLEESGDTNNSSYNTNDKCGWIRTRNRLQLNWRKRFFVLSEGTLSFYRNATPRPHGLRGQMVVTDATISVDRSKEKPWLSTLSIVTKDGLKDRYLYFNNEDKLLAWTFALECTAKGSSSTPKGMFGLLTGSRDQQVVKSPEGIPLEGFSAVVQSMKIHGERLGLSGDTIEERIARLSAKTSSRLLISAQAMTEYKVCTTDPEGDDSDTWATISATFMQTFTASGDRMVRGEEIVRVHVTNCPKTAQELQLEEFNNNNNEGGGGGSAAFSSSTAGTGTTTTANTTQDKEKDKDKASSPNSPRRIMGRRRRGSA